jgi:succinate dehydrogenase / fumarate reductase cytochrome b subunit
MNIITSVFQSSVGKKFILALTGVLLFGFVVVHLLGNLQIFLGPNALNSYAALLKANPLLLWGARLGLLTVFMTHITVATSLTLDNWAARPVAYVNNLHPYTTMASRTMVISAGMVFAFVIYHLLQFTVGVTHPEIMHFQDGQGRTDVYRMVIAGFRHPLVSVFYMLAMSLLYLHLRHGLASLFQTLGIKNKHYAGLIEGFAQVTALVLLAGYCSIPLAVLLGWGR